MTATINKRRLAAVGKKQLRRGPHSASSGEMCFMEAVAWVTGESWSDHPECVCTVIGAFARSWNDALPSDADRDRLLKPLLPLVVGTRSTVEVEQQRSWMALDWSIRVSTPAWLDLAGLADEAAALRALPEIVDSEIATASHKALNAANTKARAAKAAAGAAAGAAAWDAAKAAATDAAGDAAGAVAWAVAGAVAGDAARDAAWAAAWAVAGAVAWGAAVAAARAAAWDASTAAAWDAAWAASTAAAGAAAWDAARDAAWAAAWDAATDALSSTTLLLQESAVDLVKRMCAAS